MSVIKKPDLTDPKLRAKLAKGMGHNYYGRYFRLLRWFISLSTNTIR
jgi:hypothetical protein